MSTDQLRLHLEGKDWNRLRWDDEAVVILDTETTGVRTNDTVCEVSMLVAIRGVVEECWTTYVNPLYPFDPGATAIHGIRTEDVEDAPLLEDVAPRVIEILSYGFPLVAHGLAFDARMLRKCPLIAEAWPKDVPTLCTSDFAKHRNPATKTLPNHRLGTVAEMFGVRIDAKTMHRAEADCRALAELLPRLMRGLYIGPSMTKFSQDWIPVKDR